MLAHAETRPAYKGKIEGSLLGAPAELDPTRASSHAELTVVGFVFDTLYRVELTTGAVHPRLAAGPPELDGGKTSARIPLRKGVRFHDGGVLTAADVVASLERARLGGGKWALAPISSIKASGDAIEIVLKAPVDVATMLALAPSAITRGG
jgi:peptide/nickel transport system substrate-binding protein